MTWTSSRDDVVGTYAGLRPLIAPSDGSTVKASREHRVTVESNGVVRIGGGKYTTYRVMARDVIDAVLGREAARTRPSETAERRLVGAADSGAQARIAAELATIPAIARRAARRSAARLVARHGTEAPAVVALGAELDLLRPLVGGPCRSSRPRSPGRPVRSWRSRSTTSWPAGRGSPRSCRIAAPRSPRGSRRSSGRELGWGESRQALEVQNYLASARREFAVAPPGPPGPHGHDTRSG